MSNGSGITRSPREIDITSNGLADEIVQQNTGLQQLLQLDGESNREELSTKLKQSKSASNFEYSLLGGNEAHDGIYHGLVDVKLKSYAQSVLQEVLAAELLAGNKDKYVGKSGMELIGLLLMPTKGKRYYSRFLSKSPTRGIDREHPENYLQSLGVGLCYISEGDTFNKSIGEPLSFMPDGYGKYPTTRLGERGLVSKINSCKYFTKEGEDNSVVAYCEPDIKAYAKAQQNISHIQYEMDKLAKRMNKDRNNIGMKAFYASCCLLLYSERKKFALAKSNIDTVHEFYKLNRELRQQDVIDAMQDVVGKGLRLVGKTLQPVIGKENARFISLGFDEVPQFVQISRPKSDGSGMEKLEPISYDELKNRGENWSLSKN